MLRKEWQFQANVEQLVRAVGERLDYHNQRIDYWTNEQNVSLEKLKEQGLEVTELEVTGGIRADVRFDAKLMERLNEAKAAIKRHKAKREEYEVWSRTFSREPEERSLNLNSDDIEFFGL
jgi:hypothetical protein